MRHFLSIVIAFLFCLSSSNAQQFYLLDSTTTISLFGGSSGGIFTTKYEYDDDYRLISESFSNYELSYEYSNEYDYVKRYTVIQNNLLYNQTTYTHNSDGFVIEEYLEQNDFNSNELIPASRRIYEYDQENRLTKDEYYYIDNLGIESLSQRKTITYNDFGIEEEKFIYFIINMTEPYQTNTITHFYDEGRINMVVTISDYSGQLTTSEKIFSYDDDKLTSTEEEYYSNGQFSVAYLNVFEYSEHGIYDYQFTKYGTSPDYVASSTAYNSENITPFFEKDTSYIQFQFGDEFFNDQRTYNSVSYSTTEDTAIVRRELRGTEFEFFEFIEISKEIHTRFGDPIDSVTETEIVAEIFPNPILVGGFISLKRINPAVNKYEIFNTIGQRVALGSVWTENMTIKSPDAPGQYYVRFLEGDQAIGKIFSLSVF